MTLGRMFYEEVALHHLMSSSTSLFESEIFPIQGLIALDEVGRGCLAGPVVGGASLWLRESQVPEFLRASSKHARKWFPLVGDSKQMTAEQREICFSVVAIDFPNLAAFDLEADYQLTECTDLVVPCFEKISLDRLGGTARLAKSLKHAKLDKLVCVAAQVGAASNLEIDRVNVWNAVQIAMSRALTRLLPTLQNAGVLPQEVGLVVDGKLSIKVPRAFAQSRQLTAVGADDKFLSVGLSSVIAKVLRDKYMEKQGFIYPEYGFERHKGYATRLHCDALGKWAPTPLHRSSFLKNVGMLQAQVSELTSETL